MGGWVHEIKHDGYRLQVRRDGSAVRLFTGAAMTGLKMNVINTAQLEKRLVAPDQLLCLFPPLINDASRLSVAGPQRR
jgi:hypothetical protein